MATNNMIPYSNPAGNNQTTPTSAGAQPILNLPGTPAASPTSNPFVPISSSSVTGGPSTVPSSPVGTTSPTGYTPNTVAPGGFITSNSSYSSGENDLQKQLIDIYGKGVGGSEYALLSNISGTDSVALQEFINSLGPQEASAQAATNAALGAGGVSANSSVAALADANLRGSEFATISNESAGLTMNAEQLTAQLLQGMQPAAQSEVASSGWTDFAEVIAGITGDVGNLFGGSGGSTAANNLTSASPVPSSSTVPSASGIGTSSSLGSTGANDLSGTILNPAEEADASLAAFA